MQDFVVFFFENHVFKRFLMCDFPLDYGLFEDFFSELKSAP